MDELMTLIKDYGPALQTPIQALLVWFVWRIKSNDLPHIKEDMHNGFAELGERVAHLEGSHEFCIKKKKET